MCRVPSGLWGYVKDDAHSVGWETGMITPFSTISLRVHSICSKYSMGTFLHACWTGIMVGLVLIVSVPDIFPMVLKEAGKACFRAIMSWTTAVVQGEVTLVDFTLRPDLVIRLGV